MLLLSNVSFNKTSQQRNNHKVERDRYRKTSKTQEFDRKVNEHD
jgi:hypothetical protein